MIRAVLNLTLIVTLMASVRTFLPALDESVAGAGVALGFGFLLLAAWQTGQLFSMLRLPRLTGYLLTGIVCGPEVSGMLTTQMIDSLGIVNGVAVGLIALSAGSELNFVHIRPRFRSIVAVSLIAIPLAMFGTALVAFLLAGRLPFMHGMTSMQRIVTAATLGVVFASLSPAVAIAMISETSSAGPVSETVLGVVVIADIAIILLFATMHAVAQGQFATGAPGGSISSFTGVVIEVFGSMIAGVVVSGVLALYLRRVQAKASLFVLAVCFICAEIGTRLHLDVLLICLTAGLLLENVLGVKGENVARELAPVSLPIFAVFFGVAGAKLHIHDLKVVWPYALLFVAVRAIGHAAGAKIGSAVGRADPVVRKWLPMGMIPQAGVSVGLAVLIARHFPSWGPQARALILGVITINELVGPVLLRTALVRAGEAGKRVAVPAAQPH